MDIREKSRRTATFLRLKWRVERPPSESCAATVFFLRGKNVFAAQEIFVRITAKEGAACPDETNMWIYAF